MTLSHLLIALFLFLVTYILLRCKELSHHFKFSRFKNNPILAPRPEHWWESQAVFNPAALVHNGRVHLFYRALGNDGVSRIGHASSKDGIHFDERSDHPIYAAETFDEARDHRPYTSPARLSYDTVSYGSGGGWGGCEDPRAVNIDGEIYMTFNMFNGWESMRVAFTSLSESQLEQMRWFWKQFSFLSRPGERQKNWVLFPEKINGKFAVFYNLDKGDPSRVHIRYCDSLDMREMPRASETVDPQWLPDHEVGWHNRTRSPGPPPIKTKNGWLLLYHAMDKNDPGRYKVGALLLDLKDPERVVARSHFPVLAPDEWYENDWKPGIVYCSGAVVLGDTLFVYYGGGDKYVAAAQAPLSELIRKMQSHQNVELMPVKL